MEQTNTSAGTQQLRFEQIAPSQGNVYASRMERADQLAFIVSTDDTTVALDAPYVGCPVFMSNAEAAAIGRELLKAAKADHLLCAMSPQTNTSAGTARFAGHTPGPWRVVKDPRFKHFVVIERDEPAEKPCCAYRVAHAIDVSGLPENAANIELLRAAPDLLAETERLREQRDALMRRVFALNSALERIGDYASASEAAPSVLEHVAKLAGDACDLTTGDEWPGDPAEAAK